MKSIWYLILLFVCDVSFALEISFKSNVNLRHSPNSFIGTENVIGYVAAETKALVVDEKTLNSGVKAYKIVLSSIKPKAHFSKQIEISEAWVYGSSNLVQINGIKPAVEGQVVPKRCVNCGNTGSKAFSPLRSIVRHVETEDSKIEISKDANSVVESLKTKGFSCELRLEQIQQHGIQCKGKIEGYPESVRIYVPGNYTKNANNKMDLFFHGFKTSSSRIFEVNDSNRMGAGDFGGRLAESASTDTIVVVPESRTRLEGKRTVELTYSQFFQDGSGENYEKFVNQIQSATGSSFPSVSLSGHSGGYLPMNALLGYPKVAAKIKRVALFDGAYNQTTNISNWLNSNSENRMRLSWTKSGEVVDTSLAFIRRVSRKQQVQQVPTDGDHMDNIREGGYAEFLKGG